MIINDETPMRKLYSPAGQRLGRGLDLSLKGADGYAGVADPFPDRLIIPRSEWQARIQERKDRKQMVKDFLLKSNIPVYNQARTNYCWVNSPTFALEVSRAKQGQRHAGLSAASAGAQIKNYRNVGGWGREALQWISDNGVNTVEQWPENAIDRRYATAANKQAALNYRADEWWALEDGNLDHLISALLRGFVVSCGYNWWSHEVTLVDPDWIDGDIASDFANSWDYTWGDQGYGKLQGRKLIPDDAVAIRSAVIF